MNRLTDPDFELRDETADDRPFLDALHRGVILQAMGARADDIDPVMVSLAGMQVRARDLAYAADWPDAWRRTAWIGPERVGAVITSEGPAALHVVDIAVAPGERKRGVGRAMLEAVLREADRAGLETTARIFVSNAPSRALFAAAGFRFHAEPDQVQGVARRSSITNM
jgi:GNAT superfamily N-acetyltransferase